MTKELLFKFLDNRCSKEELEEIIQWIKEDALSEESKGLAYSDWSTFLFEGSSVHSKERFNQLLDKIHHKIKNNEFVPPEPEKRKPIRIVFQWMTRAAAILLIPVLAFLFYLFSNPTMILSQYSDSIVDSLEVIAPAGARTVVQLADGTTVHLNNGSKIKYPQTFNGKTRELTLTGEGYFEVTHDPQHPFIVNTKGLKVKALGTEFNVKSYPDDDIVETTLVEGKVVLEQSLKQGEITTIGRLVPGQHVYYNVKTDAMFSTKGATEQYVAWKDGLLIFDNSGINEVAKRLERMFNVEIEVSDDIKDYTYTVRFIDEPLSQILDLFTKATPLNYKIYPREKLADGSFSKQKILLEKRQ
ncbi:MAG: FecR domain-containing protein [Prolixibacteraceae bacterium]|nr:FecR domain-containing protein [Prolixibacteraceae bacterium]